VFSENVASIRVYYKNVFFPLCPVENLCYHSLDHSPVKTVEYWEFWFNKSSTMYSLVLQVQEVIYAYYTQSLQDLFPLTGRKESHLCFLANFSLVEFQLYNKQ